MRRSIVWITTALLVAACGDSTGPTGDHQLQVQVQTTSASAPTAGATLAPGVNAVGVDSAFLVLGGLKLETAGLDETIDWLFEESVVIRLDLSGGAVLAFDTDIPAGTYKELEVSIDKLEVGKQSEQALIDEFPSLADASVLVAGTVTRDGSTEAFVFTAALDIDMELLFPSPLTVAEDDLSVTLVTLTLDTDAWFQGAGGELFDPNSDESRSGIEVAIAASIEVAKES